MKYNWKSNVISKTSYFYLSVNNTTFRTMLLENLTLVFYILPPYMPDWQGLYMSRPVPNILTYRHSKECIKLICSAFMHDINHYRIINYI